MQLQFRNGIVEYQSLNDDPAFPNYLSRTGITGYTVNLLTANKNFVVTISQGLGEYLITWKNPVNNAWGPFNDTVNHYLYIDVHRVTGAVTFGSSLQPITFGSTFPSNPTDGQPFFLTSENMTYVWNNTAWIAKIRIYIAEVNATTLTPYGQGSTTGVVTSYASGPILYGSNGRPIIKSDKTFTTTEEPLMINDLPGNTIRLEYSIVQVEAMNNLGPFRIVKFTDFNKVDYANYADTGTKVIGLTTEPVTSGEFTTIVLSGKVTNLAWNWQTVNAALYIDANGALTEVDPAQTNPSFEAQSPIGRVIDSTSIIFTQGIDTSIFESDVLPQVDWLPNHVYGNRTGLTRYNGNYYVLLTNHTSGSTFDPQYWKPVFDTIAPWSEDTYYYSTGGFKSFIVHNGTLYQCIETHTSGSTFDSSKWDSVGGGGGSVTENWIDLITEGAGGTYTANVGDSILTDTTNGFITIRLPVAAEGDTVFVGQRKNADAPNFVIISGDGVNIAGQSEDLSLDVPFMSLKFVRRDNTYGWAVIPMGISNVVDNGSAAITTLIAANSTNIQSGSEVYPIVHALTEYSSLTLSQTRQYRLGSIENVMYDQTSLNSVLVVGILLPDAPVLGETHSLLPKYNDIIYPATPISVFVVTTDEPILNNTDGCLLLDANAPAWAVFDGTNWIITSTI